MKTITQIKKEFQALSIKCEEDMEKVFSFEQEYAGDERAGVRELIEKAEGNQVPTFVFAHTREIVE